MNREELKIELQGLVFFTILLAITYFIWYNTSMNERTQRTPQEIIAETEARLERLRLRQAKVEAKNSPEVSSLLEEKTIVQKDIREAKKLLGEGPQSAQARIEKHEAWIYKIGQSAVEAEDLLAASEERMDEIDGLISQAVAKLVETSEEMSAEAWRTEGIMV